MAQQAKEAAPVTLDGLLADPHVSALSKTALTTPAEFLEHRHLKAERRRYYDQPECVTGFDDLDASRTLAQRSVDYAEYVRELRDDCREIDERSAA